MKEPKKGDNLRALAMIYFLTGIHASMTFVIWQPFVLSLGLSMAFLGLLLSLTHTYRGLISCAIQPIGGSISDSIGRKPLLILSRTIVLTAFAFYVLAALTYSWIFLVIAALLMSISVLGVPAFQAMAAESVEAGKIGTAYSVLFFSFHVSGIFAGALGGFIAEKFGFSSVFLIALYLEGIALALVVFLLKETLAVRERPLLSARKPKSLAKQMIPRKDLRSFSMIVAIDALAWGFGGEILYGLLTDAYNFTRIQLGLIHSLGITTWVASQLPIGKLIDRYGCKTFLIISEIIGIFVITGWLTFKSFEAFALLQIAIGLVAATWAPTVLTFVSSRVPEEERARALGTISAFRGLASFPAPYIGGLLYDRFGFYAPIATNLVGVIVALILMVAFLQEPAK